MKYIVFTLALLVVLIKPAAAQHPRVDVQLTRAGGLRATVDCEELEMRIDPRGRLDIRRYPRGEVTYYDRFDRAEKRGKIKSVGSVKFDYYDVFDREELRGLLKTVGDMKITYYDVFDREELRGKVKSIGDVRVTYYDIFDRRELLGKLKSVGSKRIEYYDVFDGDLSGRVKSIKGE